MTKEDSIGRLVEEAAGTLDVTYKRIPQPVKLQFCRDAERLARGVLGLRRARDLGIHALLLDLQTDPEGNTREDSEGFKTMSRIKKTLAQEGIGEPTVDHWTAHVVGLTVHTSLGGHASIREFTRSRAKAAQTGAVKPGRQRTYGKPPNFRTD